MSALVVSLATFVLSLGLIAGLDRDAAGEQFDTDVIWIAVARHPLSRRRRRPQPLAGPALHFPDAHLRADLLELHQKRVKEFYAFLLLLEFGLIGVFVALGPVPVLRVLGSLPRADVFPDRHLGPRAPHLRRGQVLPVHHGRLRADAGRDHLSLQPRRHVRLRRRSSTMLASGQLCLHAAPSRCCCSWPSSSPSPSRCRCSRCTPGCPTRTWKLPPPAPSCWPPSC